MSSSYGIGLSDAYEYRQTPRYPSDLSYMDGFGEGWTINDAYERDREEERIYNAWVDQQQAIMYEEDINRK